MQCLTLVSSGLPCLAPFLRTVYSGALAIGKVASLVATNKTTGHKHVTETKIPRDEHTRLPRSRWESRSCSVRTSLVRRMLSAKSLGRLSTRTEDVPPTHTFFGFSSSLLPACAHLFSSSTQDQRETQSHCQPASKHSLRDVPCTDSSSTATTDSPTNRPEISPTQLRRTSFFRYRKLQAINLSP